MPRFSFSARLTRAMVHLCALVWLGLGALLALNAHAGFPDDPVVRNAMALLAASAGAALLVLLHLLRNGSRLAFFGLLTALIVGAAALLLDDFGLVDLAILGLMLVPVFLLVRDRRTYLSVSKRRP